jgi:hypothetical protein
MDRQPGGRVWGFVLLAVVVITVVALLVGYGVPVGVGALAGLILGAGSGFVGVLWLGRGAGRSVNLFGFAWDSNPLARETDAPDPATRLDDKELHEMSQISTVDLGKVDRVIGVLSTCEAASLTAELVSIELHQGGAVAILEVRLAPGTLPPGFFAQVSASDDRETTYRAAGQLLGGQPIPARYELRILPRPPSDARTLDIRVARFVDPFPRGRAREVRGPWEFQVPLAAALS